MFKSHHISCILWITIGLMTVLVQASPVDENEIKKGRECKTFCGSCGCIGFYCGEECICECNEEKNGGDTECIASIQSHAKKMKTPFEILIQGPSSNKFLKNALQFDQNQQQCSKGDSGRKKRSTVVIYKPAAEDVLNLDGFCEKPMDKEVKEVPMKMTFRGKRAIGEDSWFTDFSNTLTKPAPIGGKSIEADDETEDVDEVEEEEPEPKVNATEVQKSKDKKKEKIIPKIREFRKEIRNALDIGENESIVKGIRKKVRKIEDKALKAVELDGTAKKIRGAISNILLPTPEETDESKLSTGKKILNKLRGKIFHSFGEDEELES